MTTRTEQAAAIAAELAPAWPLERFVAVNPLAGLEHLPFAEAVEHAQHTLGAPGWRAEEELRAADVTDDELVAALRARVGEMLDEPAGDEHAVADVLLADLRHGPAVAPVPRLCLTPAEAWDIQLGERLADTADTLMTGWLAAYLDTGQARWAMPRRELGLYGAWRALAPRDPAFSRAARRRIAELPDDAEHAFAALLDGTGLDAEQVLRALLTRQPGWTSHARWRAEHRGDLAFIDIATVRLACERALLEPAAGPDALSRVPAVAAPAPADAEARIAAVAAALDVPADSQVAGALDLLAPTARPAVWQAAIEARFRRELLARIDDVPAGAEDGPARPAAQAVFCIDVRSEPLRRALEATGPYTTLGFAGFFGLAVEIQALGGEAPTEQCPVLVSPAATVAEVPADGAQERAGRMLRRTARRAAARDAFAGAKKGLAAKYAFAEAVGFVMGPVAAAKTAAPGRTRRGDSAPAVPTRMDVSILPVADRAAAARGALLAMGLVDGFADLVLLCGHGSTTTNNPHQAALDCGACGGHRGASNARAMAEVLNDAEVRALLAADGIAIPDTTWFAAGEHDTATDEVVLLDDHAVPATHRAAVDRLRADLALAGAATALERSARFADGQAPDVRSRDWAQVAPEWGLAGCAALVVGPRSLTRGRDLGSRVFLHSYERDADPQGEALTVILTAPLVVAHWIASQYYFSSVAPEQFGAGTKISHNVVSGIGVLSGPGGDLRGGLPWESVAVGDRLEHQPMRLLAIVDAPLDRIDAILAGAPQVERLIDGEWLTLVARDDETGPWVRRMPGGAWQSATAIEVPA